MSYRAWPAALLTGAALAAACVVVGEHVVQTSDGCLESTGWFTAAPVGWSDTSAQSEQHLGTQDKPGTGTTGTAPEVTAIVGQQNKADQQISGCLDLDRIEITPTPAPDGRA